MFSTQSSDLNRIQSTYLATRTHAVGMNHMYLQPVVCKSPSTNVASIGDEDLTDKLIEQRIPT